MVFYGQRRNKMIKSIMKIELDLRVTPLHRYNLDFLERQTDDELLRIHRMLTDWKVSQINRSLG